MDWPRISILEINVRIILMSEWITVHVVGITQDTVWLSVWNGDSYKAWPLRAFISLPRRFPRPDLHIRGTV